MRRREASSKVNGKGTAARFSSPSLSHWTLAAICTAKTGWAERFPAAWPPRLLPVRRSGASLQTAAERQRASPIRAALPLCTWPTAATTRSAGSPVCCPRGRRCLAGLVRARPPARPAFGAARRSGQWQSDLLDDAERGCGG